MTHHVKAKSRLVIALAVVLVACASGVALAAGGTGARGAAGLPDAARQRDIDLVRALLKSGADVNTTQPDGATALHWAAHWDDAAMADLLLRAGARVNQANEYGATPLWLASLNGSSTMVKKLLESGAHPNVALHFGETPLLAAARGGALDVVRALLAGGANVNAKERMQGQTPLMWAAAEGHLEVMRTLIDGGASVVEGSKGGFTPLMFAARQGSIEAARLLLDRGAAINAESADGVTPLLTAVVRGHVDLAEFLLERGADPNLGGAGYTPLHWAAGTWESAFVTDYVLPDGEWGALRGLPSLEIKLRMIKLLVAHGADVNAVGKREPPRSGFALISAQLPRKGITPFFIAAMSADVPVMRLLVALGADPTLPSANHTTPLMVAAGRVRVDQETRIREEDALAAVKLAVELGVPINAVNDAGETALHAAAIAGFNSVVEYLVAHGASMTVRNRLGKTPAEWAEDGHEFGTLLVQRPSTAALLRKLEAAK